MSASDPEGIGLLPELNTNYDGRRGYLGHASLYSDGWWLVYTTRREPVRREPWVRDAATGEVRKEVTTSYPLQGSDVTYWKTGVHARALKVEIVHTFTDHEAESHLPNEVVWVDGKWVLYRARARASSSSTTQRVRPPFWATARTFPPTAGWHAHKLLRMEADDTAYFAEASKRERGVGGAGRRNEPRDCA